MKKVQALFNSSGVSPDCQMARKGSVRYDRRYGQYLKGMTDILSNGQGEPDSFILRIILVICWYEGGDKSYGIDV